MTDTTEAMRAAIKKLERHLDYVKEDFPFAPETAGGKRLQGAYDALWQLHDLLPKVQAALASQTVPVDATIVKLALDNLKKIDKQDSIEITTAIAHLFTFLADTPGLNIAEYTAAPAADREGK